VRTCVMSVFVYDRLWSRFLCIATSKSEVSSVVYTVYTWTFKVLGRLSARLKCWA
jgi:hypothetical protein